MNINELEELLSLNNEVKINNLHCNKCDIEFFNGAEYTHYQAINSFTWKVTFWCRTCARGCGLLR